MILFCSSFCLVCEGQEKQFTRSQSNKNYGVHHFSLVGEAKVYTKGVCSSKKPSASTGQNEVWCIPKLLIFFLRKRGIIHIHQRTFEVFAGDLIARYWCIDLGVLLGKRKRKKYTPSRSCMHSPEGAPGQCGQLRSAENIACGRCVDNPRFEGPQMLGRHCALSGSLRRDW